MEGAFPGLGTVINVATIVIGSLLGMAVGHRLPDRTRSVVTDCLAWAIESGQDAGVWGGLSEDERRALKRRNARARARLA